MRVLVHLKSTNINTVSHFRRIVAGASFPISRGGNPDMQVNYYKTSRSDNASSLYFDNVYRFYLFVLGLRAL